MDSDKAVSFLCFPLCRAIEWELPDYRQNDDEEAVAYSQHRPGDDPSEIFDIREYREGDNLKHIHWKLSWKLEQPMVKEFSLPLHSSLEIALELGKVPPEQLDLQLDLCFSLARVLLEGGLSFRLTWLGATMQSLHISDENDWEEAIGFLLSEPCREIPGLLFEDHIFLSQTYYITALISESLPLQEDFSVLYCGELTGQTRRLLRVLQDEGHVVFTPEDFFAQNSSRSSEE